jgi:transcriptional regulator with PAS, ATPase and Fis domain
LIEAKHRTPASQVPDEPIYFDLLWEHELDELKPILEALGRRRQEALEYWYELYLLHFRDRRALSQTEFFRIYGPDIEATADALGQKDFERFVSAIRRVGETLAERRVPFSEVVASMHLFEESAVRLFPNATDPASYRLFDKISHCRTIVLADSYFRSQAAVAAARVEHLEREAAQLPHRERARFHGLVGATPSMRRLYEQIEATGAVRGTVLIVGESGTGKELVARAIHECSPVARAPFVALNCAALPRDLIESELFGYKRGAFSGANSEHLGLFRAAEGGSLFLDEITEMSAETQSKLLRSLQEHTIRPVGATAEVPVDVRVIASTNREPETAIRSGRLREDLYYRLQVNVLHVPPLRDRPDDIELLVEHFIVLFNEKLRRALPIRAVAPEAIEAMRRYSWPGNVRELSNAIETAFTFAHSDIIRPSDLPDSLTAGSPVSSSAPASPSGLNFTEMERELIRRALERAGGNKQRAAGLLGVSRKKLYAKIAKYGLPGVRRR